MAQPQCSTCGETFNSTYHYELHQELDACDDAANASETPSQSSQPESQGTDSPTEVMEPATGTVCEFNEDRGFGFITTTDITSKTAHGMNTEDIFFHISDIDTTWIDHGDRLTFTVVQTADGLQATNIDIIQRDRDRDSYDKPEDNIGDNPQGFGHQKDDGQYGTGKAGPTDSDIEAFQDDRKFR